MDLNEAIYRINLVMALEVLRSEKKFQEALQEGVDAIKEKLEREKGGAQ